MHALWRWLVLLVAALLALQLFFVARIALMAVVDPQSTSFQRSEAWRLATQGPAQAAPAKGRKPEPANGDWQWRQQWVGYDQIADALKRAVIASEDSGFPSHEGVDWEALEKAWEKNEKAQARAERQTQAAPVGKPARTPKIVGGSTITQQLAKNLLLSGERTLLRKGQEFVLTLLLETFLSKQRILEIYLNSVEWGEGVFGAEAAAQHYYKKSAARLTAYEAARLAVMLPRPRHYEKLPQSPYLASRANTIVARMGDVSLP
ncbi:monofunctional biosynthetic peptidoglycan transglycosylase [Pseudorhodoferax sp. Leaf267]|uniref:monofunctional biosynthetic peptidoglycan transglycosylase n=1 Tax=Pseudorhodoferax sp. Leaf267 TaxID=1736316 RepID=UPI0006FACB7B|nr:monofunctional biosynthetic peptidoglycan transglycosylase [Pseudorhodoferax sp. Leaf267]KQP14151.1 monofunctional biosynthetic peptidoglycan transglycosylase [Pseudorhodoferax sp. Leaf267]